MNILFVSTHPKEKQHASGLPLQEAWIADAFLHSGESVAIETIYAADEALPDALRAEAIVIGGSAHSVFEELPWIGDLERLLAEAIQKGTPVLGICFGHQLIAQALGGRVAHAPRGSEIGATRLRLTEAGKKDWLFHDVPESFIAAMLHHDLVTDFPTTIPHTELAYNQAYRGQAVAYGEHVRTVQFHPEFTSEIITGIIQKYAEDLVTKGAIKDLDHADYLIKVARETDLSVGNILFRNFAQFVKEKRRS